MNAKLLLRRDESSMKLRSFFSILAGVVLVLLLAGAAGAYWLATASAPQLPQQAAVNPAAAIFVSRQAPAMVSLLVNPDRLEAFWLAEAPPANRKPLKAELDRLQQSLFANTSLDYDRDLKPWLGNEVTFVLTTPDVDRDAADGLQPGYLLVLTTEDFESAQKSVQAFWQRQAAAKDLVIEQFAGVQLVHAAHKKAASAQPSLTSAVVGNRYVLFANYPKVLREALNHVQVPELSLEQSFTYQQALEKVSDQRFGLVYLNFSQFGTWLAEQPILPTVASDASRYEGLVAALEPDAQGLLANTILLLTPGAEPLGRSIAADTSEVLKFVPERSSMAIVSQDLEQTWAQWQNVWASSSAWAELQQDWGIDSPETLFNWVKGEYALVQVPRADGAKPDWVFVTQRSPQTEAGLEQLDQIAQQQQVNIGSLWLNDQKIYAWTKLTTTKQLGTTSLQAEVQGVRTSVGDYEIFATSLEALEQALQASQTAAGTSDLETTIRQVQTPNQGYLYLNRAALDQRLRSIRLPKPLKDQLSANLQSALITSYTTDETGLRGAIVLHLNQR